MELRDEEYRKKAIRAPRQQIWVAYGAISENLKKAVLINEDAAFFSHKGIDLDELKAALKKDWETMSFNRGGSTITMQLAKNLYLNPSKNPLRKAERNHHRQTTRASLIETADFRDLSERRRMGAQCLWRGSRGAILFR